jgi:8-oxo-dGTP pyrophosphatase MutT (NUDIX family)
MASESLTVERVGNLLASRLERGEEPSPAPHLVSSAVLLPLLPGDDALEAELLFIRRAGGLPDHAGQVSFPGGVQEAGDVSLYATALRESEEEVGVDSASVECVGALAPVSTLEKYWIQPFLSIWPAGEYRSASPEEVAHVFRVPLAWLLAADESVEVEVEVPGARLRVPAYIYDGEVIWGATRRITLDLLTRLRAALGKGFL